MPTLLTTKLPLAGWGKVFDPNTAVTAIADRLVHNLEIFILGEKNYQKKQK
jgi:DNA replication protein DnaC